MIFFVDSFLYLERFHEPFSYIPGCRHVALVSQIFILRRLWPLRVCDGNENQGTSGQAVLPDLLDAALRERGHVFA